MNLKLYPTLEVKNVFKQEKIVPQLMFNPGLTLTGFRTTPAQSCERQRCLEESVTCIWNRPFSSCLLPLPVASERAFVRNYSNECVFPIQVHFQAKQTQFHMKSFARGLVLKTMAY